MKLPRILIIGSSGFLGSSLAAILKNRSVVIESTNRTEIDLSQPISLSAKERIKFGNYQYVAICASISDVEQCFQEKGLSEQVNVVATIDLLKVIQQSGAVPIFFSSDYVFPNTVALHREGDRRAPETKYGQQKFTVERFIEQTFEHFLIFRTSKLISMTTHSKNILNPLLQSLKTSKTVRCFENQWLNPVFVEDIAKIVEVASVQHLSGTFHLGTRQVFTRAELGRFLARSFGFDPNLIHSIKMSDIEFSEPRPTHNTLDCSRIEKALDFQFTEIENALHDLHSLVE